MNNEIFRPNDNIKLYIQEIEKFYKELLNYETFSNNRNVREIVNLIINRIQIFKNEYIMNCEIQEQELKNDLNNFFTTICDFYYEIFMNIQGQAFLAERNLLENYYSRFENI